MHDQVLGGRHIFFSLRGSYFGRLISTSHVNTARQRKQSACTRDAEFALAIARNIVAAKINNQMIVARRYGRTVRMDLARFCGSMNASSKAVMQSTTISQLTDHEGFAARQYFRVLGSLVDPDFKFAGRTRRPPRDPFNSLISLGYTLLLSEIYGKVELRSLNPYWAFFHQDHERHPTLASDLIEDWRAVIVDSLALSCLNGHEISRDNFEFGDNGGVTLDRYAFKAFVQKFEAKMNTKSRYLDYVDCSLSFRNAIELHVCRLAKAIDGNDPGYYRPIRIR